MDRVLVIGGGLAGCTAALELAENGREVVIVEKSGAIGGAVRQYGCKATDQCNKCGLCLVGDLWKRVEKDERIEILCSCEVRDIQGIKGNYRAVLKNGKAMETINEIASIVVAIGFDKVDARLAGSFELGSFPSVMTGKQLDELCANRNKDGLFEKVPQSVAFMQCYGSRDLKQKAGYCSRVCCNYATRIAKVLRSYYPDMRIVFFYMDLQQVETGEYFESLTQMGIEFIRSRPVRFKENSPGTILYEKPGCSGMMEEKFDLIVLSEGIHPASDAGSIAEISNLGLDRDGFLKYVTSGDTTGIYIAGCASGPKKIEETYADALLTARELYSAEAI